MSLNSQELVDVLDDVIYKINCLPICAAEFLGQDLWERVCAARGVVVDDEEEEEWEWVDCDE